MVASLSSGHVTLMKKYYKNSGTWHSYDLPQVLKERGVDDPKKLPNFHYREDALKLWAAIEEFVYEILSVYYHSDDDVKKVQCCKYSDLNSHEFKLITFKVLKT